MAKLEEITRVVGYSLADLDAYDVRVLHIALERLRVDVEHAALNKPVINEGMKVNLTNLTNIVNEIIRRDAE